MHYYTVIADCWMYGKHYKAGDKIKLNDKQAKYEMYSGHIANVAEPEPKPVVAKSKKPDLKAEEL